MASYEIAKSGPVGRELKRVAAGQLARARKVLSPENESVAKGIHEARTRFKKARAVLRVAKSGLGKKQFRRENRILRDAGREIRDARDSVAVIEALDVLIAECFAAGPPDILRLLRRMLVREASKLGREVEAAGVLKRAGRQIREELKLVKEWKLDGFAEKDARRAWRKARKAYRAAYRAADAEPTADNLHEWRKRAKALWNETRLLRKPCPDLREHVEDVESLTQLLGEDRDLGMLEEAIVARRDRLAHPVQRREVLHLLADRRMQLQTAAFALGATV